MQRGLTIIIGTAFPAAALGTLVFMISASHTIPALYWEVMSNKTQTQGCGINYGHNVNMVVPGAVGIWVLCWYASMVWPLVRGTNAFKIVEGILFTLMTPVRWLSRRVGGLGICLGLLLAAALSSGDHIMLSCARGICGTDSTGDYCVYRRRLLPCRNFALFAGLFSFVIAEVVVPYVGRTRQERRDRRRALQDAERRIEMMRRGKDAGQTPSSAAQDGSAAGAGNVTGTDIPPTSRVNSGSEQKRAEAANGS
ncbi:hypothetical protein BDV96DRAFT_650168 [Lophiotrema nucula]|uniref:Uncharacterized protein n=1 Tax=Lophiotrema nucula TaxID=690887 RepID=A0A6A5YY75_9PLEO|nr:hypothetical protein BDV96DRAFT_650168 [Lophiotrema nucula]